MNLHEKSTKLGRELLERGLSICAAESCTGGLFLSTLTDVAGSSAYVLGGVVTYSNAMKQQLIGVREETLLAHGAVSEQTAREMVQGVRQLIGADIAVSITGIAGPGGAMPEKPVGLVYIAVGIQDHIQVSRNVWSGDRIANKAQSVEQAIQMILDHFATAG